VSTNTHLVDFDDLDCPAKTKPSTAELHPRSWTPVEFLECSSRCTAFFLVLHAFPGTRIVRLGFAIALVLGRGGGRAVVTLA
jgi:hypothetical protein